MNKTRYALLGLLAEKPASGYDLKRVVEMRFPLFWRESYGQIYPELKRMAGEGLVDCEREGSRQRTVYAITDEGHRALGQWLDREAEEDLIRSEVLLKLYFSALGPEEVRIRHLETLKSRAQAHLGWLEAAAAQLEEVLHEDVTHPRALAVVRLGQATQRAQVAWAEDELARIRGPLAGGRPSGP